MTDREKFEEHIKSAAWYRVLSEAAKEDDEGASVFRMARMAASEAWQESRRAALEEISSILMDHSIPHLAVRMNDAMKLIDVALANGGANG